MAYAFIHSEKVRLAFWAAISITIFLLCNELWAQQALSFVGGCCVAEFEEKRTMPYQTKKTQFTPGGIVFLLIASLLAFICKHTIGNVFPERVIYGLQLIYLLSAALTIILIVKCIKWKTNIEAVGTVVIVSRLLSLVGMISYELYLVHGYFENVIRSHSIGYS